MKERRRKDGDRRIKEERKINEILGLMYFGTTKFENDANQPFCFQLLQHHLKKSIMLRLDPGPLVRLGENPQSSTLV